MRGRENAAFPFPDDDEDDDDDDEARQNEARAAGETENPAEALRARVAAASRGALEHLRATRVPGSFQALAEDSTKYGACMAALTRRGGGSKSERAETRTAEMHELVRRQVVKYDSKLRTALRPETAEGSAHPHRDGREDVLDPSADAATGLDVMGPSGGDARSGPDLGSERDLRRLGLAAPAARPLRDAPRFGSMPDFPRGSRGSGLDDRTRTLRSGGRLEGAERASGALRETSDGESDGG